MSMSSPRALAEISAAASSGMMPSRPWTRASAASTSSHFCILPALGKHRAHGLGAEEVPVDPAVDDGDWHRSALPPLPPARGTLKRFSPVAGIARRLRARRRGGSLSARLRREGPAMVKALLFDVFGTVVGLAGLRGAGGKEGAGAERPRPRLARFRPALAGPLPAGHGGSSEAARGLTPSSTCFHRENLDSPAGGVRRVGAGRSREGRSQPRLAPSRRLGRMQFWDSPASSANTLSAPARTAISRSW